VTESGEAGYSRLKSKLVQNTTRVLPLVFPLILSSNFSHFHLFNVLTISQEEA